MRPRPFFQYVIGSFVQLASGAPMQRVVWRGKQWVPSITGRQPYEVPVYRLDNEHWDLLLRARAARGPARTIAPATAGSRPRYASH